MPIRKRTSDVMLRKREKFGRKEVVAGCVVINGDFETGDLTGWTCDAFIGGCSVLEDAGNHYVHLTLE